MMSKFELYCMIFYVLDSAWDEKHSEELTDFLSAANPFLYTDIGSADPSIYIHFCETVADDITIEGSYETALLYIESLGNKAVSEAFNTVDKEEWTECVAEYLSQDHKGSNL